MKRKRANLFHNFPLFSVVKKPNKGSYRFLCLQTGLSFHLNMIKDNSRISPFEAQGGLLNSKQFRHSTPIVSEVEEEEQQGKNSEKV